MIKKIEVLTNVAIIITALLLCAVLAKKHLFVDKQSPSPTPAAPARSTGPHSLKVGEKISIPSVNWAPNERTLVIALSTSCRFCTESAPFYQLLEKEKQPNLRFLAVLPQPPDESRKYLTKLALKVPDVIQLPLASIGVSRTPTLISSRQEWIGEAILDWKARRPRICEGHSGTQDWDLEFQKMIHGGE